MKRIGFLLVLCIISLGLKGQVNIIKDNLNGKDDGVPHANPVDQLLIVFKDKLVFTGTNRYVDLSTDGDYEPWIYDPTINSIGILKDIVPLKSSNPNKYVNAGDKFYFGATDEFFLVDRLFVSDGTKNGTLNMGDTINKLSGMLRNFSRNTIVPINNGVLFNAYVSSTEFGLWYSNGTSTGTINLNKDGFADNFIYHPKYKVALFTQNSAFIISDGTIGGTRALNDLLNISSVASASVDMGTFKDDFVMEALDPNTGTFGFFRTNGILQTYTKLVDFGNLPSQARNVTDIGNGRFIFSNKRGIWVSDGTPAGTALVANIVPFKADNFYTDLWAAYKGKVYFAASDPMNNKGVELYESDGTIAGTKLFMDLNSGSGDGMPYNFVVYHDILYFSATSASAGNELWQSDGSVIGTKMIADINTGTGSSNPQHITGLGDKLYFFASDGKTGYELWKYGGAKVGVQNVLRDHSLYLYPHWASQYVELQYEEGSADQVIISNLNGCQVKDIKLSGSIGHLDVQELSPGYYILSLYHEGNRVAVRKLFKPE